jgi:hypothetical protein
MQMHDNVLSFVQYNFLFLYSINTMDAQSYTFDRLEKTNNKKKFMHFVEKKLKQNNYINDNFVTYALQQI